MVMSGTWVGMWETALSTHNSKGCTLVWLWKTNVARPMLVPGWLAVQRTLCLPLLDRGFLLRPVTGRPSG